MTSLPTAAPISPAPAAPKPNRQAWYRPTLSPEHGVYVMLLGSFLTGAAAAQQWTWATTLALICAFCGFQAEHPWMLQIKQRKSFKPRFWLWGGLYTGVSGAIALYLYGRQNTVLSPLLWIYLGAAIAFIADGIFVFQRDQKSILNELITFFAVCLSTMLAYVVTLGTLPFTVVGLWLCNSLFFSSAIFTVKLRKTKTHSVIPGLVYHAIATLLILLLWAMQGLAPITALAFVTVWVKFTWILWQRDWYCKTKIQSVAALETGTALVFLAIVALSLLPRYGPG